MKRRDSLKRCKNVVMCSLVLAIALLLGVYVHAEEVRGVSPGLIKIGILSDLTGPIADSSLPYSKGAETFFRYISDQGGIHGRKIKTIREDDRYSIPSSIAAFKKLVFLDKVLACVGPESPMSIALMPQIEKNRIPMIVYSAMSVMTKPFKRYIFPPVASYRDQSIVLVDYAVKSPGGKDARIGYLCPDKVYYSEFLTAVKDTARHHGVKVVADSTFSTSTIDATSHVLNMKRAGANFILTVGSVGSIVALLKDSKRYGYKPTILGIDPACTDEVVRLTGKACKNLIAAHGFASWHEDNPGIKGMKKIVLGYYPKIKPQPRHYTWGWVSAMVLAEGLRNAGKKLTVESLVQGMEEIRDFDSKGLTGPITYTPTNHRGGKYYRLHKPDLEKGYFIPVTDWLKPSIK